MLGSKDVMATVAVRSLAAARPFYEETLGLEAADESEAAHGVAFEAYDMPGAVKDGPVHVMGGMKVVWFKDPDGNILSLGDY